MSSIGVEQGTLSLVVNNVEEERVRLSNISSRGSDLETDIARARNDAKFEVLRQLFGYDYIDGIIQEGKSDVCT